MDREIDAAASYGVDFFEVLARPEKRRGGGKGGLFCVSGANIFCTSVLSTADPLLRPISGPAPAKCAAAEPGSGGVYQLHQRREDEVGGGGRVASSVIYLGLSSSVIYLGLSWLCDTREFSLSSHL
jgi:hypothetical protein